MKQIDPTLLSQEEALNTLNNQKEIARHNAAMDVEQSTHATNNQNELNRHVSVLNTLLSDISVTQPIITTPITSSSNNQSQLNAEEALFDNVWWVNGSYGFDEKTYTSTIATNGQEVGKLNTKKGNVDIPYYGRILTKVPGQTWPILSMDGKIPTMIDDNWLSFKNVASTYYQSAEVSPVAAPFEIWFVFRILPSSTFEAYFTPGDNCGYIANAGTGLRIINQDTGYLPGSVAPTLFATHIGRLVIQSQSSASFYIDNVSQGTYPFTPSDINTMFKRHFMVGAITNNANWDFAAMYFKIGNFSSTDTITVYNSLANKWQQGSIPNQILLNNISWTKKNNIYTPSATIVNTPAGIKIADPSKWDYQWYWRNNNDNLDIQTPLSTKYQLTVADFPAGYTSAAGGFALKVTIRPKDVNGNTWRYFDGIFANY
jgi:hypothetical protein